MPEESKDDTREILDGYIEYARQDGYALTAYGAIEKGSWSAYSGVAKHCFNDRLEFGVMAGVAHYDNELHPALNPWIFYESHRWEFMLFTENYFDTDKPNFYRGHGYYNLGQFQVGGYGESELGGGPSVAMRVKKEVTIVTVAPIAGRPDHGRRDLSLMFRVRF